MSVVLYLFILDKMRVLLKGKNLKNSCARRYACHKTLFSGQHPCLLYITNQLHYNYQTSNFKKGEKIQPQYFIHPSTLFAHILHIHFPFVILQHKNNVYLKFTEHSLKLFVYMKNRLER